MKYYDKIMSGIFTSLLAGLSIGAITAIPLTIGTGFGGGVSLFCMYLGLFRNAPVPTVETIA